MSIKFALMTNEKLTKDQINAIREIDFEKDGNSKVNVNFTINAIDTQTGTEFLIQNKRVITGVVQEAFNRRASAGPLG